MELSEGQNQDGLASEAATTEAQQTTEQPSPQQQPVEAPKMSFKERMTEKLTPKKTEGKPAESPSVPAIQPPAGMTKEQKERFSKLPVDDQKYLSEMYGKFRSDYGRQTQALKTVEQKIRPIYELLTPMEQELVKLGIKPEEAIKEGLELKKALALDKKKAARDFFQRYQIDPIDFIDDDPSPGEQPAPQVDPAELERQITEKVMRQIQEKSLEEQRKVALQSSDAVVQKFMKGKPLFSDPEIGSRLEQAMADDLARQLAFNPNQDLETLLEDSFKYFTERIPEFSEIQKKYNAKAEAEKLQEEANKAKLASRSISGGAHTPVPNSNKGVPFKTAFARNLGASYD